MAVVPRAMQSLREGVDTDVTTTKEGSLPVPRRYLVRGGTSSAALHGWSPCRAAFFCSRD